LNLRKIIVFVLLLLTGSLAAWAQPRKVENLPKFDQKKFHFGFTLAYNSSNFTVRREPDFANFQNLRIVESQAQPGFNLGIIADYHITPVLNLRFIPGLAFVQRNLEYTLFDNGGGNRPTLIRKPVESTYLDFPLLLKYRSARLNNFAAYVVGGFKYSIDLASQEDVFDPEIVKVFRQDFAWEVGVGFDFFMDYFKFSPEIKLSFGIPDLLVREGTIYTNPIRRLTSRVVVISFHFEG
jgi:hypothetical protein